MKPEFELTDDNAADVTAIVAALDNVPLALELAAARLRVLTPAALFERLDRALPLLVGGARDRPERQRTLRATIDWSAQLLSDPERDLLLRLSVFRSGFSLDAAEWMCEDSDAEDAVDLLAALVESSLVQEQDRGSRSVVLDARDGPRVRAGRTRTPRRPADVPSSGTPSSSRNSPPSPNRTSSAPSRAPWIARLHDEFEDIRAAVDHYLATEQGDAVADLVWPLYWFWWITGRIPRSPETGSPALADDDDQVSDRTRFRAKFYVAGAGDLEQTRPEPHPRPDGLPCLLPPGARPLR